MGASPGTLGGGGKPLRPAFFRPSFLTPWGHSEPHTLLSRLRSTVAEVEVPGGELQRAFEGTWDVAGQEPYEPGTNPKWS